MKMLWRETFRVRTWSLLNVFFLWLTRPQIIEMSDDRCVVRIPLNWRTRRRDIHAMYLGTLCMGADVAAGLIAFRLVEARKERVSFIFKDIRGEFLRRPKRGQDPMARLLPADEGCLSKTVWVPCPSAAMCSEFLRRPKR